VLEGGCWEATGARRSPRYTGDLTIDERLERLTGRHEALTQSLELLHQDVQSLLETSRQDGENIRALARIAGIHERRLTQLEGGQ
jgi:hypothetical protein